MMINRQDQFPVDLATLRAYERQVKKVLNLGKLDFNVCFVTDEEISHMNSVYRGKPTPTDVLSFPWDGEGEGGPEGPSEEFRDFLGDIVISIATAERNARAEGHSIDEEIRLLILHGTLHLLGYDHEADRGEMNSLELSVREQLSRAASGFSGQQARSGGGAA